MKNQQSHNQSHQRKRARRDQRLPSPPAMRLTDRDIAIMKAVESFELLTTKQIQELFFPSLHQAYHRLSKLYHHRYLLRHFMGVYTDKMNMPMLYSLDQRGAELLRSEFGIEASSRSGRKQPSALFLDHMIAINDVRIAVTKSVEQRADFMLIEWQRENDLKASYDYVTIRTRQGRAQRVSLIPDGFFALRTPLGKAAFCLELDRGTMTTKRFKNKVLAYQAYYTSGAYQRRFQTTSFRVVTVTTSKKRLENLKQASEDAGGRQRFWFTTTSALKQRNVLLDAIWAVATRDVDTCLIEL